MSDREIAAKIPLSFFSNFCSKMTVNYYEEEVLLNENGVSTMVEIKNQGYPDSLKSNSVAKYAIYATPGGRIKVSFNSFNLPKHDGCSNLWLTVSEDPNLRYYPYFFYSF